MYSNDFFCQLKLFTGRKHSLYFYTFFFSRLIFTYGVAVITRVILGFFFYVHLASYLSALFLVLDQTVNSLFYITSESTTMPKRAAKVAGIYQQSYKRTF